MWRSSKSSRAATRSRRATRADRSVGVPDRQSSDGSQRRFSRRRTDVARHRHRCARQEATLAEMRGEGEGRAQTVRTGGDGVGRLWIPLGTWTRPTGRGALSSREARALLGRPPALTHAARPRARRGIRGSSREALSGAPQSGREPWRPGRAACRGGLSPREEDSAPRPVGRVHVRAGIHSRPTPSPPVRTV